MTRMLRLVIVLLVMSHSAFVWADTIVVVAGPGSPSDAALPAEQKLKSPFGLGVTPAGTIVVVEMTGHRVREIDDMGGVRTIAGTGVEGFAGDGSLARVARFNGMHALAINASGDLLIADTWNQRVRRIDADTREIVTIAGTGEKGFSGDGGLAKDAKFGGIYSIALTADGTKMYLADLDNRRIRAVDFTTGEVRTVAGNGEKGVPKDGALAIDSPLVDPRAVAVDVQGNLYILERNGNALRMVSPDGKIRTVAGTGKAGLSGDGGPAIEATLNGPKDLAIDRDGGVLIADTENHCIRKYVPAEGKIFRVAGTGKKGTAGIGGSPVEAELAQPHGVAIDRKGSILISDSSNNRIVKIHRP